MKGNMNNFMIKWDKSRGQALLIKFRIYSYGAKSPLVLLCWTLSKYSIVTYSPALITPLTSHLSLDYNRHYYPYLHMRKMKQAKFATCPR